MISALDRLVVSLLRHIGEQRPERGLEMGLKSGVEPASQPSRIGAISVMVV